MKATVLKIDAKDPDPDVAAQTVRVLRQGGVIAYPTETVYGLGCDPFRPDAVERLRRLKGRKAPVPFLLLISKRESIDSLVNGVSSAAERLMAEFWPGPLTLVFSASGRAPAAVLGGMRTIGMRQSSNPFCRILLGLLDGPLVSTSANHSGEESAKTADKVIVSFSGDLDLIVDGGTLGDSLPSTIIDVSRSEPHLLREGALPKLAISRIVELRHD